GSGSACWGGTCRTTTTSGRTRPWTTGRPGRCTRGESAVAEAFFFAAPDLSPGEGRERRKRMPEKRGPTGAWRNQGAGLSLMCSEGSPFFGLDNGVHLTI